MKTIRPNIKIGKWINAGIFISLQLLKNKEKQPKQFIDFLFFLQCLPLNSNKEEPIFFRRKDLYHLVSKRNKRIKFPIYFLSEKINNPFNMFFKILSYKDKPVIKHIEDDIYSLNNIYDFLKIKTPYKKLFRLLVTDDLIKKYKGDFSALRKDALFLALLELIKITPDIILTEYQLNSIFGINSYDISNFCREFSMEKEIIYHQLNSIEEQKLNLVSSNCLADEKYYELPIGFSLNFKNKFLPKIINKLSDKLGMYQINYRILHSIKHRIEENKISYYEEEDFQEDMKIKMERLIKFEDTKDKNKRSPKLSYGHWNFNKNKKLFRIIDERDPRKLNDIRKIVN